MNLLQLNNLFRLCPRLIRPAGMMLLLPLLSVTARCDQEGDFEFQIDGDGVVITAYLGPGGDVVIPDMLDFYPVTGIGSSAFFGVKSLTSVTIPNSVIGIGGYGFSGCTSLSSVWMGYFF